MPLFNTLFEATWTTLFQETTKTTNRRLNINMLKIPPYQHAYVWNEHKITALLNGIMLSLNDKPYYFLGNIVLCKGENMPTINDYFIVDGQQRIPSLTVLISTIRQISFENNFKDVEKQCDDFMECEKTMR
jgi:uncharacterized protein with ParB-like and HNH nuclease domain